MEKKLLVFVLTVLCSGVVLAGSGKEKKFQPMKVDVEQTTVSPVTVLGGEPPRASSINWVAVDTMQNAFGPASRSLKPIAYDSASNTVAMVHRGRTTYARSSGELWYNISRNAGVSWRRVGALNTGVATLTRYPSCAIANPTNSPDTSSVLFVYAAPQLLPSGSAFGAAMYGVDFPIGADQAIAFETQGDGSFWSNLSIWSVPGGVDLNWVVYRRGTVLHDDLYRWNTTTSFTAINEGRPANWDSAQFNAQFGLDIGGMYRNGKHYFGKWGQWTGDPNIVDNPGYSTSTDGGVTWSTWTRPQPDFRSISGIGGSKDWWSYGGPGAYSFDMLVDASSRVHFFGVIIDTLTLQRDLVEIYETSSGWASKVVKSNLNTTTDFTYGALNQMGNHINASMNVSGSVMALVWLDAPSGSTRPDIWFSWRHINNANWSTPVNLTATPDFAELLLHAAPTLKTNSASSYTMFIGRSYESGSTAYPPVDTNPTVFYVGTHTWTLTNVQDDKTSVPGRFALEQNYPNPFNPSTRISFTIPTSSEVTLSVYNTLGQEVATLMNEYKPAGSYEVEFSASNLTSGVYFYTLRAGQFSETRKMVLMK